MRASKGDIALIESVGDHIEKYIGEIGFVLHEKESPHVHVDVHVVKPTPERPYFVLVTSGMSELPMPVPDGALDGRYAELVICLPQDWPMSPEAFQSEENWWPIRLLKGLARYPHEHETWLYDGHSVCWSDPPEPFAPNTQMTSAVLLKPRLIPEPAHIIHFRKNKHARLWAVSPLYQDELDLKLRDGSDSLEKLFSKRGITELLDIRRRTVAVVN